jgi:diguanylate cyclase (GGDEF)-like protein
VRTYLVLIVLAAVVAVTTGSGYGFWWSAREARINATEAMAVQAQRAAASITASVALAKTSAEGLAAQPGLLQVFKDAAGCTLAAAGGSPFRSARLDIVASDGTVVCSSDPGATSTAGAVHAKTEWLRTALHSKGTLVDWNATDGVTRQPAVAVIVPLGKAGVIALFQHVPQATAGLVRDFAGPEHAGFTIVDREHGAVVSTSEARGTHQPLGGMRFPSSKTAGDWAGVDGARRIFNSAEVSRSKWRVYAGVERSAVLADARGALTRQLLVGWLVLLVVVAAVWILNRRVAGPLRSVTAAVARAGREPNAARVEEAGTAELVTLAREINAMLDVRAGHEAQLLYQATHDPLTGLPNRALLCGQLDDALAQDGVPVAVFWLGVDRLDLVTDGFGHDAGDHVLVEVAERLSDALGPHDTLARFGGAEFIVLSEGLPSKDLGDVAVRLRRCLEQPFRGPDSDIVVHASIGIAVPRTAATTSEQLLREADGAMRQAKRSGRGWCLFDLELQARATHHLATEHALRLALERDELLVHYQPLVEVATGKIVGTEALVRWQHPERGMVPPLEFIPTAEQTGQIAAIGRFVLTRACAQAAAWAAAGHPLRMSVNVAVDQLRDDDFPGIVRQVLSDSGLHPRQLCLELTESSLMREAAQGSAQLAQLKRLGVELAIDDFGTGYSSLSYLHDLPVDELKVDRSFISRVDRERRDRHLVEAIIGMTRAMGLTVVAEGVETNQQWEFIAGLGCDLAQGYLFARPQDADELLGLLRAQAANRLVEVDVGADPRGGGRSAQPA